MDKIYRTKVDLWLLILLYTPMAVPLIETLFIEFSLPKLLLPIIYYPFITVLIAKIKYVIHGDFLHIHYSFLYTEKIDISTIIHIKPTHSLLAAPAASLDRMAIASKQGTFIVSPADKIGFIHQLSGINPNIEIL